MAKPQHLAALAATALMACVLTNSSAAEENTAAAVLPPAEPAGDTMPLVAQPRQSSPGTESLYADSHALVIGNDVYTNGWPQLSNAVRDAEQVAIALRNKGFKVEFHANLGSLQLADVFKRFFIIKGADRDARLFVWYAGHGATLDGEGYLVPADSPSPKHAAEFKLGALALRDFGTFMRQAVAKHVYAVFDSCFAGTVFTSQRSAPTSAITLATTLPVRQFLTSGDAFQTVSDDGTFQELFIRAINGEERSDSNGDGYVTATELGMFLGDRMTNLTRSLQTPRYGKLRDKDYDRGDFVFALPGSSLPNLRTAPEASFENATELAYWESVKSSKSKEQLNAYLLKYPNGNFIELAMLRKKDLEKQRRRGSTRPKVRQHIDVHFIDRDFEARSVANVRAWPSASAEKVARLEPGARVWALGETRVDGEPWYRIARDGVQLGFVYGQLLAEVERSDEPPPPPPMPSSAELSETTSDNKVETMDERFSTLLDQIIEGSKDP